MVPDGDCHDGGKRLDFGILSRVVLHEDIGRRARPLVVNRRKECGSVEEAMLCVQISGLNAAADFVGRILFTGHVSPLVRGRELEYLADSSSQIGFKLQHF